MPLVLSHLSENVSCAPNGELMEVRSWNSPLLMQEEGAVRCLPNWQGGVMKRASLGCREVPMESLKSPVSLIRAERIHFSTADQSEREEIQKRLVLWQISKQESVNHWDRSENSANGKRGWWNFTFEKQKGPFIFCLSVVWLLLRTSCLLSDITGKIRATSAADELVNTCRH